MKTVMTGLAILLLGAACQGALDPSSEGESSVEASTAALAAPFAKAPVAASATGVSGNGCSAPYLTCVNEGTSYGVDNLSSYVRMSGGTGTHLLSFPGVGKLTALTTHVRAGTASAWTAGTVQVKVYNGSTLLGTGPAHRLSSGWATFDDAFALNASVNQSIKVAVVLTRVQGAADVRYSIAWASGQLDSATCSSSAGCAAGSYCNAGTCTPLKGNGTACVSSSECTSGVCANGVCGGAQSCSSSAGCAAGSYCNAGTCTPLKGNGTACTSSGECLSGRCLNGVC